MLGDKGTVSINVSFDKFMSFKDNSANLVSEEGEIIDFLVGPSKTQELLICHMKL